MRVLLQYFMNIYFVLMFSICINGGFFFQPNTLTNISCWRQQVDTDRSNSLNYQEFIRLCAIPQLSAAVAALERQVDL